MGAAVSGVLLGPLVVIACGSSNPSGSGQTCTPGSTQACVGPGACIGGQACRSDGQGYDACNCGNQADAGAGDVLSLPDAPGTDSGSSSGTDSGGMDGSTDSLSDSSGGSSTDGSEGGDCPPATSQYIYVMSDDSSPSANTLFTFDPKIFPSASAFAPVGPVPCVPAGGYVNSIAIDREGNAYLNMLPDGSIWKMSTTPPLTCTATSFTAGQAGFTNGLGMAFAVDPSDPSGETLYVSDNHGPLGNCTASTPTMGSCWGLGLGHIDTSSWALTRIGTGYTSTASGYNAELTGTGMNGSHPLYGLFTTTPSSYGPIDPLLGTTDNPAPTSVSAVNIATGGYGFSFYGGDFYFYTSATGNTIPQHLSTATGMVTSGATLAFVVVAAGASTCVPSVPPQ
jgi:hypothetical protein